MKLITRHTDYAIRALCYIAARKDKIVPVTELVSALKIPRPFLRKILQTLTRSGILKSCKGKGGGFSAAHKLKQVPLAELIKIFQGSLQLNECTFKKKACPNRNTCTLRKRIIYIEKRTFADLVHITIGSLL